MINIIMGSSCSCVDSNSVVKLNDELELIHMESPMTEKYDDFPSVKSLNSPKSQNLQLSADISLKNTFESCSSIVKQVEESLGPFIFSTLEDHVENFPITETNVNGKIYIGQRDESGQKCGKGIFI